MHDAARGFADLFGTEEAVPPAPAPAPAEATPAPEPAPVTPAEAAHAPATPTGAQASTARQMWHALRVAYYQGRRTWREARNHPGGPIFTIEHWKPPSIAEQIAYRDGRGWVPPGHAGGWSDTWGVRYQSCWGIPAMIPAVIWIWIVTSAYRQGVALLVTIALAAFVVALFHFGVI